MKKEMREQAAREAVKHEVVEVKQNLRDLLRQQKAALREATREVARVRSAYRKESEKSGRSKSTLERLKQASEVEVRAARDVRVTTQKLSELGSESDVERRVSFTLSSWAKERRQKRVESVGQIEPVFDFLLDLPYENLFEQAGNRSSVIDWVCKACRKPVKSWLREEHYLAHKERRVPVARARRGSSKSGGARSSAGGGRGVRGHQVADDLVKRIVKAIESGTYLKQIASDLNGEKVPHPSGAAWNPDRVRRVWMKATGNVGNRQAWKDAVVKYGLKEEKAPRTTRRLAKSKSASAKSTPAKSSSKKKSSSGAGAKRKTTAVTKRAASKPANGKTSNGAARSTGARDLAKADVTPIPKPQKAEKKRTVRRKP